MDSRESVYTENLFFFIFVSVKKETFNELAVWMVNAGSFIQFYVYADAFSLVRNFFYCGFEMIAYNGKFLNYEFY